MANIIRMRFHDRGVQVSGEQSDCQCGGHSADAGSTDPSAPRSLTFDGSNTFGVSNLPKPYQPPGRAAGFNERAKKWWAAR